MDLAGNLTSENETSFSVEQFVVQRSPENEIFTKIFVILLIILITIANVLMGCELDLNVVLSTVKKPIAPAIGFFTQFIIMPILAYCISCLVLVSQGLQPFALGLFVTGCSPAGGASNFWTLLLDGNAHLSVTMTFISTIGALVMMPLWMNFLGYKFLKGYLDNARVHVPYSKIVMSLLALVIPLLIGVTIARYKPTCASKARKLLRPFIIFVLAFVVILGVITNYHIFTLITWHALLAGLLLPWCGFMFGCFTSILLRQKPEDVTAIAIETGVQNTGIAIMLLKISFPEPDADVSSLLPIIVACFTPGPLLLGYAVHSLTKRMKSRRSQPLDEKKADPLLSVHSDEIMSLFTSPSYHHVSPLTRSRSRSLSQSNLRRSHSYTGAQSGGAFTLPSYGYGGGFMSRSLSRSGSSLFGRSLSATALNKTPPFSNVAVQRSTPHYSDKYPYVRYSYGNVETGLSVLTQTEMKSPNIYGIRDIGTKRWLEGKLNAYNTGLFTRPNYKTTIERPITPARNYVRHMPMEDAVDMYKKRCMTVGTLSKYWLSPTTYSTRRDKELNISSASAVGRFSHPSQYNQYNRPAYYSRVTSRLY
ncbi:sodium bile acid symporter family domain-containing protein [Ditylenchus destructor]|uniref:Sodium bile acid symporter family domain-containing protein n=1 Tax=Ditylenchus destructor TaxID=166010 RepID=A0AAD4MY61_9BILA|nr:sodium bile acid symporter family domain-containing protein [Ditylenchus destructor]